MSIKIATPCYCGPLYLLDFHCVFGIVHIKVRTSGAGVLGENLWLSVPSTGQ